MVHPIILSSPSPLPRRFAWVNISVGQHFSDISFTTLTSPPFLHLITLGQFTTMLGGRTRVKELAHVISFQSSTREMITAATTATNMIRSSI